MPNHQQPPTIDIGVAAGSIPDIGGGGRAIGQHGPMTTTAAGIGHAIDLQTLYAELNSPSSVEDLGSLMRLHVPPPTGGEPLQLRLRPGSVEHDHAASPLRIRIPPLPPTIAGGVQNIGQQQRRRHTPIHYELSANFAAHQAGQLLPHGSSGGGGGGGGDGGSVEPRASLRWREGSLPELPLMDSGHSRLSMRSRQLDPGAHDELKMSIASNALVAPDTDVDCEEFTAWEVAHAACVHLINGTAPPERREEWALLLTMPYLEPHMRFHLAQIDVPVLEPTSWLGLGLG